jgi:hypothetical protein
MKPPISLTGAARDVFVMVLDRFLHVIDACMNASSFV